MTSNQLNYQRNLEYARTNRASEFETNRSNLAKEQENYRSNTARETETYRNNVAELEENRRAAIARQQEIDRSNRASEALGWSNVNLGYANLAEKAKNDRAIESINAQNANTNAKNATTNAQARYDKAMDFQSLAQDRVQSRNIQAFSVGANLVGSAFNTAANIGKSVLPMLAG